jgi:hypothetical protein
MKKFAFILTACLAVFLGTATAQDEEQLATLKFLVVKDFNGKPLRNASVVLHPVNKKGKQERGGIQLKCDADGKANYEGVPYGKLRVQVLMPGFQTFGDDYVVDKPEMEIVVKMKRPVDQYSIYTDHTNVKKDDTAPVEKKEDNTQPGQSKDKPQ